MNRTGKIVVGIAGLGAVAGLSGAGAELFLSLSPKPVTVICKQGLDVSFLPAWKTALVEIKPDVIVAGAAADYSDKSAVYDATRQIGDKIKKEGAPALICALTPNYVSSNGYFGNMLVGVITTEPGAAPLAAAEAEAFNQKMGGFLTCEVVAGGGNESKNQDLLYLGFKQAANGSFYLPTEVVRATPSLTIAGFKI